MPGGTGDQHHRRQVEDADPAVAAAEWSATLQRAAGKRERRQPQGAHPEPPRVDAIGPGGRTRDAERALHADAARVRPDAGVQAPAAVGTPPDPDRRRRLTRLPSGALIAVVRAPTLAPP